jgi:C-terminal processing protease CtpA/Prc
LKNPSLSRKTAIGIGFVFTALLGLLPLLASSHAYTKADHDAVRAMLRDAAADVQKHYYDTKLHNVDWDAGVRQAEKNIDAADSMDSAVSEIAALLDSLHDSHTYFNPPPRSYTTDYGFKVRVIGERCFVMEVHGGSDAEKKGLKLGDEVTSINNISVSRKTLWKIAYIFNQLRPQPGLQLVISREDGPHKLEVLSKIQPASIVRYALNQGSTSQYAIGWTRRACWNLAIFRKATIF